jgi:hypothetical protein
MFWRWAKTANRIRKVEQLNLHGEETATLCCVDTVSYSHLSLIHHLQRRSQIRYGITVPSATMAQYMYMSLHPKFGLYFRAVISSPNSSICFVRANNAWVNQVLPGLGELVMNQWNKSKREEAQNSTQGHLGECQDLCLAYQLFFFCPLYVYTYIFPSACQAKSYIEPWIIGHFKRMITFHECQEIFGGLYDGDVWSTFPNKFQSL